MAVVVWAKLYKSVSMSNDEKRSKKPKGLVTRSSDYISWLYLQYCLITGLYMLEPWERAIFNAFVIGLVSIIAFIVYAFVPLPFSGALGV
uniref:Uncharacterized protein n=1 Tax=Plectus sambesii TaxID=2011161 RepID=A0A914UWV7_9BILA